ncbi:deoxyribonuclease [Elysia marginata]|uniref:Deoxyribonuclease n=1 Tax=Elysia marginata TaxID=1093978 RepID=A0AAV4HXN8_9GAST|nr:deoxyribonuclease [Elysia marginata]
MGMFEYEAVPHVSGWFSKHFKLAMVSGAIVAGLVIATIIVVPTALALSGQEAYIQAYANSNFTVSKGLSSFYSPVKVAAFNIKSFGLAKSSKEFAYQYIVKILSRYDVILIQEVRDKSRRSLKKLWHSLNETGVSYGSVYSDNLGRTTYTEQYVFFYRIKKAEVTATQQYDDSRDDDFEREPFTIELSYYSPQDKRKKRIALMALHTKPKDAAAELAKLPAVMKRTLQHFKHSQGIIALGDFNADCTYLSKKKKNSLELFKKDSGFKSLLHDSVDTTVASSTDCAYDRAFVYGKKVKVSEATVFNFQTAFDLSEKDAKEISDHYPIEFMLL